MYLIATSKPGSYEARLEDGVRAVETYHYLFHGRLQAIYTIAEANGPAARVAIVDGEDPSCVSRIPVKFFGDFDDLDQARAEIEQLVGDNGLDVRLVRQ